MTLSREVARDLALLSMFPPEELEGAVLIVTSGANDSTLGEAYGAPHITERDDVLRQMRIESGATGSSNEFSLAILTLQQEMTDEDETLLELIVDRLSPRGSLVIALPGPLDASTLRSISIGAPNQMFEIFVASSVIGVERSTLESAVRGEPIEPLRIESMSAHLPQRSPSDTHGVPSAALSFAIWGGMIGERVVRSTSLRAPQDGVLVGFAASTRPFFAGNRDDSAEHSLLVRGLEAERELLVRELQRAALDSSVGSGRMGRSPNSERSSRNGSVRTLRRLLGRLRRTIRR